jgi:hypothetical protein
LLLRRQRQLLRETFHDPLVLGDGAPISTMHALGVMIETGSDDSGENPGAKEDDQTRP